MSDHSDTSDLATTASAQGEFAFGQGDLAAARAHFSRAGKILEDTASKKLRTSDKHFFLFLAATQFYKGGEYRTALKLSQKIQQSLLPEDTSKIFSQFFRDVKKRSADRYGQDVRMRVLRHYQRKEFDKVLDEMREHPYATTPNRVLFLRATMCESLGRFDAAAYYYGKLFKAKNVDPGYLFTAAAFPLQLPHEGYLEKAWHYVKLQLQEIDHPLVDLVASIICFHRASDMKGDARLEHTREQVAYFEKGWSGFTELPAEIQGHAEVRDLIGLANQCAAMAYWRLDINDKALHHANEGIRFEPFDPHAYTTRGLVLFPDEACYADFERAVQLNDNTYFAYYYLAERAMRRKEFQQAIDLTAKALNCKPRKAIESELHNCRAIALDAVGSDEMYVDMEFRLAVECDPTNGAAVDNLATFLNSKSESSQSPDWVFPTKPVNRIKDFFQDNVPHSKTNAPRIAADRIKETSFMELAEVS